MLAPWKKSYDQSREHVKKQRHYFANKDPFSQSYGFSSSHVWMWELDQSVLKEVNPEYSLKGLMVKLKLQYFGHLMWRTDSMEMTLILGKINGRRRRGQHRMRPMRPMSSMDVSLSKLWEIVKDREGWHAAVHVVAKSRTWLMKWATTIFMNQDFQYLNNQSKKFLVPWMSNKTAVICCQM